MRSYQPTEAIQRGIKRLLSLPVLPERTFFRFHRFFRYGILTFQFQGSSLRIENQTKMFENNPTVGQEVATIV